MKRTQQQIVYIGIIIFMLLYVFTPVGFFLKVHFNRISAFSPSLLEEDEQRQLRSYQWEVVDDNGHVYSLEDSKGKVIIVNFWATWCAPCVAEMPELQQLYDAYKDQASFLFVASDDINRVNAFMEKKHYNLPVYYAKGKPLSEFDHATIPTTYVIDKNGYIVLIKSGAADWNSEKMHKTITSLLEQ